MSYLKRVTVVKQYLLKRTYFPSSQYISFIMVGSGRSVVIFSKYQNSRPESGWKTMLVERKIKILSADLVCMQNKFGRENKFQIGSSKYNIWQPFCDTFYSCFRCIFFFHFWWENNFLFKKKYYHEYLSNKCLLIQWKLLYHRWFDYLTVARTSRVLCLNCD